MRGSLLLTFGIVVLSGLNGANAAHALGTATSATASSWPMLAHDSLRTAYQPNPGNLSRRTVSRLKLRWSYQSGTQITASPIVANGMVYVGDLNGTVTALDEKSGAMRWRQTVTPGPYIRMTPTFANGNLYVGTRVADGLPSVGPPTVFTALNASTGAIAWAYRTTLVLRSEPVADGSTVYMGLAGGDQPFCARGGLVAFDSANGKVKWAWYVAPVDHAGGSVWAPLTFADGLLIFGTGNVCTNDTNAANGVVALHPDGSLAYSIPVANATLDDDVGTSVTVLDPHFAIVGSKSGNFVAFDPSAGTVLWNKLLGVVPGLGSVGTAATDGRRIYISNGYMHNPATVPGGGGQLLALDRNGNVLWHYDKAAWAIPGGPALTRDLLFLDVDSRIVALDPASGEQLWAYTASGLFYASPAITSNGVYAADKSGRVYAFSVDGQ